MDEPKIKMLLRQHLFTNIARSVFFTLLLIFLLTSYLHFKNIYLDQTRWWVISIIAILIFRLVVAHLSKKNLEHSDLGYSLLVVSGFLLGAILGYSFYLYFFQMNITEQTLLLLFLVGLIAGSTSTMVSSRVSFVTFVTPILVPIMMRYLEDDTIPARVIAMSIAIYIGFLMVVYSTNRRLIIENITLLIQQRQLNMELARFNQKLNVVSITDDLTGLANRRYFQERLIADWNRAKRAKLPLTLMLIDIDHFKECNDRYGHLYGDECLKEIGKTLATLVRRKTDLAVRYGGDEFIILHFNTSIEESINFAQRLVATVKKLKLKNENSPIHPYISLSVGIANMIPEAHEDYETLFERADKALYDAKAKGRDCIVTYTEV